MESSTVARRDPFLHKLLQSPDKQIRLLRFVQAGPKDTDEISIELSPWVDKEAPEYKAISYTWGNPIDLRSIQVNGSSLTIRQNCHYALWQTCLHWPNDYIWIDSICINQDDVAEKSVQVQKMSKIYANAHTVLLCVGPHQDRSEYLKQYAQELKIIEDSRRDLGSKFGDMALDFLMYNSADWVLLRDQAYVDEATVTLKAFASRSYWSRLWIVQEVVLGKKKIVHCGNHILEWPSVKSINNTVHGNTYLNTLVCQVRKSLKLSNAIGTVRGFHCSNVLDRIYGILGLIDWKGQRATPYIVDYTLTSFDLLIQVVDDLDLEVTDVVNAMYMFGHTSASSEMQELIAYARQSNEVPSNAETMRYEDSLVARKVLVSSASHCEIHENPDGWLVANFSKYDEPDKTHGPPGFQYYSSLRVADSEVPDGAKRLYSGDSLCALLCAQARPGDLIISNSFPRDDNLLVLRPLEGDEYSIIGQALGINDFRPKIDEQDERYFNTEVEVKLTSLEAILLYGQDFMGFDSPILGSAMHDRQAQLQRLQTDVVLDRSSASRAKIVRDEALSNYTTELSLEESAELFGNAGGILWSESDSESASTLGNQEGEEEEHYFEIHESGYLSESDSDDVEGIQRFR